jgi:hypothetical protein
MANETEFNTPAIWINKYLQEKLEPIFGNPPQFFPTQPSTLEALTSSFPPGDIFATYDRMFKMNRSGFPHIKCEQMLYYFYSFGNTPVPDVVRATETIFRLLDRADESAQEVNSWCSNRRVDLKDGNSPVDNMFYFHDFKVYQLEETRDIIDFGTARTYAGNKIIIDFDYHQMPSLTNNNWTPEPKLRGDDKLTI